MITDAINMIEIMNNNCLLNQILAYLIGGFVGAFSMWHWAQENCKDKKK